MITEYWGIVYAIMKSLNITELEIDKKYFIVNKENLEYMTFNEDIKTGKLIVKIKENK